MNLKQLRYFAHVADAGNMTRAAESLHVAQPALTQQITNLEARFVSDIRRPPARRVDPAVLSA